MKLQTSELLGSDLDRAVSPSRRLDLKIPIITTTTGETVKILTSCAFGDYPLVGHIGNDQELYKWNEWGIPQPFAEFPAPHIHNGNPEPEVRYINLYENGEIGCSRSLITATKLANSAPVSNRCIARRKITFEYGVFDDE